MKSTAAACAVAILCVIPAAHADHDLSGKYSGSFVFPGRYGDTQVGLTLAIQSVEDGKVKATANSTSRQCFGDYSMEGSYKGEEVRLRSTSGPRADCALGLVLTHEGGKLVGKTGGGHSVALSK